MSNLKLYSKARKRRIGPEARLQMAVVQYLKLAGVPGLLYFSVPNEQKCSVQRGAMLKKMGRLAGVSDLVILIPRVIHGSDEPVVLFLELKAKGERLNENQRRFQVEADAIGAAYEWADNINDVISLLRQFGAIKNVARRSSSPLSEAA